MPLMMGVFLGKRKDHLHTVMINKWSLGVRRHNGSQVTLKVTFWESLKYAMSLYRGEAENLRAVLSR